MSSYYPGSIDYYADEERQPQLPVYDHPSLNQPSMAEVVILEPTSFEEMPEAIQALRKQQTVVLNLIHMGHEDAQRSVDFLAGGPIMFNGSLEKIDQKVFIFAPQNTEIFFDGNYGRPNNNTEAFSQGKAFHKHSYVIPGGIEQQNLMQKAS